MLQVRVDARLTELHAGSPPLTVPPRARHRFRNPGTQAVVVQVTFDGTRNEDAHVPVAVHLAGRPIRARDLVRLFVHDAEVGATLAAFEPINAAQRWFARIMKLVGVKPCPIVERW